MINFGPISNVIGVLLVVIGTLMLTALPFSWYYQTGQGLSILYSSLITLSCGAFFWFIKFSNSNNVNKREGYLIVTLGWLSLVVFGMLPYLFSGSIPTITSAFFETVSGTTTTGASVLTDIEAVPKDILFWRSMTQWIGGMGIIVLTVALFPLLGIGGIELFVAEAPGPTSDKLHPRIRETAKRLWLIYVSLTASLVLLLMWGGMTFYDAINHALTTMATGGFSTKNASIAHFESAFIQYTLILFMFLAGTNFSMIYWGLKGRIKRVWKNEEFRSYFLLTAVATLLVLRVVYIVSDQTFEKSLRDSLFQVVSVVTTTGFVSADYTSWSESITLLFFVLLFVGGSAGSTAGGIKHIRHLVFFRNSLLEFKRILHPRAIVPLKINGEVVAPRIMTHVIIFLLIYLMTFLLGSFAVSALGLDFLTSIGAVATCLGNVGPGIGEVGPVDNFSAVPMGAKWVLSFLMLLGRLELFTILVLFTPYFWKSN